MRRRILKVRWLIQRKNDLIKKLQELHRFQQFNCNSFFVGKEVSAINQLSHDQQKRKAVRQLRFIERLLGKK